MSDAELNVAESGSQEISSSVTGVFTALELIGGEKKKQRHPRVYEKIFMEPECRKIEITEKKLQKLEEFFHVWVRDARLLDKKKKKTNPEAEESLDNAAQKNIYTDQHPLSIRLSKTTTIDELRQQIQEKYSITGAFSISKEGPLNLMFEGKILLDGSAFGDYLSRKQESKRKWVKPYLGVVWIVPFRSIPKVSKEWKGEYAIDELSKSTHTA